jgi:hypothetical protein
VLRASPIASTLTWWPENVRWRVGQKTNHEGSNMRFSAASLYCLPLRSECSHPLPVFKQPGCVDYNTVKSCRWLPTFRRKLSLPSSG